MNKKSTRPRPSAGIINLHVTPKSSKNQILGWITDADGKPVLKIRVAAPPEDGKANAELIKFLSKQWDISKSMLEITGGESSRHKRLKIHNTKVCEQLMTELAAVRQ